MNFKYFLLVLIFGAISTNSFASTKKRSLTDIDETQEQKAKRQRQTVARYKEQRNLPNLRTELSSNQQSVLFYKLYQLFSALEIDGRQEPFAPDVIIEVRDLLIHDKPIKVMAPASDTHWVIQIKGVRNGRLQVNFSECIPHCNEGRWLLLQHGPEIFEGSPIKLVVTANPQAAASSSSLVKNQS
jgi:hypothetical protein